MKIKEVLGSALLLSASTFAAFLALELGAYAILRLTPDTYEPFKHIAWMRHSFHPLFKAPRDDFRYWPYVGRALGPAWKTPPPDLPRPFSEAYVYSDFYGRDLPMRKPMGELRVFILGGSTVAGMGSSSAAASIPDRLEHWMRTRLPKSSSRTIRVVNAGIPGAASTQEQVLLATRLLAFEPDLIVTLDAFNDFADFWNSPNLPPFWNSYDKSLYESFNRMQTPGGILAQIAFLLSKRFYCLALPRALRHDILTSARFQRKLAEAAPESQPEVGDELDKVLNTYRSNLRTIVGIGQGHGIPVVAALQPNSGYAKPRLSDEERRIVEDNERQGNRGWSKAIVEFYGRARRMFGELARSHPGRVVDLSALFERRAETIYVDRCHYNDRGADEIARALAGPAYAALKSRAGAGL